MDSLPHDRPDQPVVRTITRITPGKRRPNRANVYLDGQFAFACNLNVVARFKLREGRKLDAAELEKIERGEIRQECFDKAMRFLQMRLHSRSELRRKLIRNEYAPAMVDEVLDDLARMDYINDERFALAKARSAATHKHHGRRRALMELLKAGVKSEVASRAIEEVFDPADSLATARELAARQAPRLRKLEAEVARRRLAGMLQRRGFDYSDIKPVIDEVLGSA